STTVTRWRAISQNGLDWDLFSDSGNGYGFVDTVAEFDALKVGVTLKKGIGSNFVPLKLQNVLITKSDQLIVGNVIDGTKVEILNSS
ncbi:hypothetical protein, partial [Pseudomonas sp. GP01-A3]|uniref:hypothetical protein n=1 Tax=Pseudomonas sp. GP01-A3 TaxID=2070568 RepID=UPI001304FCAA